MVLPISRLGGAWLNWYENGTERSFNPYSGSDEFLLSGVLRSMLKSSSRRLGVRVVCLFRSKISRMHQYSGKIAPPQMI